MTRLDSYFEALRGKRVLVLGVGVSNRPLVRLLLHYGIDVTCCDKTPRDKLDDEVLELEKNGAKLHLGPDYLDGLTGDVVFRTPGLHPDTPQIKALREAGAVVTSEMEAFFAVCPCRILCVLRNPTHRQSQTLPVLQLQAQWCFLTSHDSACTAFSRFGTVLEAAHK